MPTKDQTEDIIAEHRDEIRRRTQAAVTELTDFVEESGLISIASAMLTVEEVVSTRAADEYDAEQPKKKKKKTPLSKPMIKKIDYLYDLFVELQGKEPGGVRAIQAWKDALRLMMQQDKLELGQIEKMIRWVAQDVCQRGTWLGWKYQILSLPNLRKHREKILAQMFRPPPGGFDNSSFDDDLEF